MPHDPLAPRRDRRLPQGSEGLGAHGVTIPDALRAAMIARRVGPSDVARLTGLDRKTVWNYLHGRSRPRLKVIAIFAEVLDWPDLTEAIGGMPGIGTFDRVAIGRLGEYQESVAAFCRSCEPVTRVCRDATCELRGVSPLPLIALSSVTRRSAA